MITDTAKNLFEGLKLVLMYPRTRLEGFRPSLASSALLMAIGVAVLAAFGYSKQQGDIYFNDWGAALLGSMLFVAVITAIAITRLHGSLERLPEFLTPLASAFPWVVIALSALSLILEPTGDSLYWGLALIWCMSIVIGAIQRAFPQAGGSVYFVTVVLISGLTLGATHRGYSPELFFSYDDSLYEEYAEYDEYLSLDQEAVFVSQSALLESELARIVPGDPGETDFYFLGFAGNGDEGVFASEAHFVEEQVSREFPTAGRSLVLASDFDNLSSQPLANTHNLFAAISDFGDKMDVEDDILFLFLTSHGSSDASIQVAMYPLELKRLYAEELQENLDAAGIEWRIIVVSACYSGSFIEPLRTERTVVMTAAADDRMSFGCSSDRDLTYFGEALFRDTLASGGSLFDRFDDAREAIRTREESEGRTSSEPQIFIGAEIAEKLALR